MTDTAKAEPTKAPKTDADCWPFECAPYHETWAHTEGEFPCACPCHDARNKD